MIIEKTIFCILNNIYFENICVFDCRLSQRRKLCGFEVQYFLYGPTIFDPFVRALVEKQAGGRLGITIGMTGKER